VTAVVGPFELDHHQLRPAVNRQEVNPASGVLKQGILLRHHEQVLAEHLDALAQQALQVVALADPLCRERGGRNLDKIVRPHAVQRHGHRSTPTWAPCTTTDQLRPSGQRSRHGCMNRATIASGAVTTPCRWPRWGAPLASVTIHDQGPWSAQAAPVGLPL
jgi:hypothetical protein